MEKIIFFDTEVSKNTGRIMDYGALSSDGTFLHTQSTADFIKFIQESDFLCGHNVFKFDLIHLKNQLEKEFVPYYFEKRNVIDTLYWSALLFPEHPYHRLLKDDKLETEELNNPLNDAKKAQNLFYDEVRAFRTLPDSLKKIYYSLLALQEEFSAFFQAIGYYGRNLETEVLIRSYFDGKICSNAPLQELSLQMPAELAYSLALVQAEDTCSITPPWILKNYPKLPEVLTKLRGTPCGNCRYCVEKQDALRGLKEFFGYEEYRDFDGIPLQRQAVQAAIEKKSLLAVFPTGGGKSITFQVPALMAGRNERGLTVVISPLQSLMQDQVYNLERIGITDAVTINGLLDPLERAEAIRRVEEGKAKILYIAPESLRSRSIERLLLDRNVVRFVVDEAHCFSAWGQDFRVDYLYIGEFIRRLCEKKKLGKSIPVSCFTATAKQNVIADICTYFREELGLELELFAAGSSRKNLIYKVLPVKDVQKYTCIRRLLDMKKCPTIIYVSRTKRAEELAKRLNQDGYFAKAYHGQMEKREKSANQRAFVGGEVDIIVATSAFGMGVDKKDVGMVIHYDISDSLENYVQEAGRAGRDPSIFADCYVLYDEADLNKHFTLLNQTKISMQEIQQVWRAVKEMTKQRMKFSSSALELARAAGWDGVVKELETRVKTAINALEEANYIKRGENIPHIYADSILVRSVMEAEKKIAASGRFTDAERQDAIRVVSRLIKEDTRVDYIADHLGMEKSEVLHIIQKLREAKILADAKDLTVYMEEKTDLQKSLNILRGFAQLEDFLLEKLQEKEMVVSIKQLNEEAQGAGNKRMTVGKLLCVLNFWAMKGFIEKKNAFQNRDVVRITWQKEPDDIGKFLQRQRRVAESVLCYLDKIREHEETTITFSVLEIIEEYNKKPSPEFTVDAKAVENALLYLNRMGILKLEGGFLVSYSALSIERLERDNKIRYKVEDYKRLKLYYEQKVQMIHIVGEYAKKVTEDYQGALQFVEDYFQMEYTAFLRKYFRGERAEEIRRNITGKKFEQLFGSLSVTQLQIITDKEAPCIVVAAGPGSGKTRVLVHKLASLLLMEDVKHEQLLMLTFSRAAAMEFKQRLYGLIENSAAYVEIKTFHSYCFDLLGRVGNLQRSGNIVQDAVESICAGEVERSRITKTVLVIDEAQDMEEQEFRLVQTLMDYNDDIRMIAVGDDDQNIYEFRGSSSAYMKRLLDREGAKYYELVENYRSLSNLVAYTNHFATCIFDRMKTNPIVPVQKDYGKITVVEYRYPNLIFPVVQKMINDGISKGTCVLTWKNDTALQVAGLFLKLGKRVKLVQERGDFPLKNLREIRYFSALLKIGEGDYIIGEERWSIAKAEFFKSFGKSSEYELCSNVIAMFELSNPETKYVSDWQLYLEESQIGDFYREGEEEVYVSTMHKSKGHEYEHVVLLLDDYKVATEERKRLLYVAMTRAKKTLAIHYAGTYLRRCGKPSEGMVPYLDYEYDEIDYPESGLVIFQMGLKDVFLSYFYRSQNFVKRLQSGDEIGVDDAGCLDARGNRLMFYSRKFQEKLQKYFSDGYHILRAKVSFMYYWHEEGREEEVLVMLPQLELIKKTSQEVNAACTVEKGNFY